MNDRELKLTLITVAVLATAGLWVLIVEPALARAKTLHEREAALSAAVEDGRRLRDALPELESRRQAIEVALRPAGEEAVIPGFVAYLQGETEAAGFDPLSLRYMSAEGLADLDRERRDPDARDVYAELRFELRAQVTLAQLQAFLVRLATAARPVRVTSLGLTPASGQGVGPDVLEANLSLLALAPLDVLPEEEDR